MKKFLKNNIYFILVLLLSLPSVFALFKGGFYGASDDMHIAWLFEMDRIIKIWQIPPRFVPDLSFGFGYPLFNFVFPLPFYLGELYHLIGLNFVDSIKLVYGLSLVGSSLAMYVLLKEFLNKELSLVGSLIYLYTPYRATDVYSRGAIGESLSFVFLPLIILSIIKIYKNCIDKIHTKIDWKNILTFSLSLAALILSHNIVSYMFFPFILLLVIIFLFNLANKKLFIVNNLLGIIFGLSISIYFWLPAIIESSLMKYETVFNFKDHFPTMKQLITPYFGYGSSVPGPYDWMSFFLGTLNIFILISGILLSIFFWKRFRRLEKNIFIWSVIVFFLSIFMMNYRSSFIWDNIPFLTYFQFPWRFLTLTTFSSVFFLLPLNYLTKNKVFKMIIPLGLVIFTIFINVNYFKPHDFLGRTDSYYINRYIPFPLPSQEYLTLQEEYLRLPKNLTERPSKVYPILFSNEEVNYQVIKEDGLSTTINFEMGNNGLVYYNKYYFPGWSAKLDGKEVKLSAGKPFAQVSLYVEKGKHTVEFKFKEVWYRKILNWFSLLTFVSLIVLNCKYKNHEKNNK
jgi:hypothetical protein